MRTPLQWFSLSNAAAELADLVRDMWSKFTGMSSLQDPVIYQLLLFLSVVIQTGKDACHKRMSWHDAPVHSSAFERAICVLC
jgi:hypothetical protein